MRVAFIEHFLESIADELGTTPAEVVNRFLARTRSLTPGEQAELLGAVLEDAPPTPTPTRNAAPTRSAPTRAAPSPPRSTAPSQSQSRSAPQSNGQSRARQGGGFDFGRFMNGVQQGVGFFSQGAQAISSIAALFGGSTAQDVSRVAGQLGQGGSQVGAMLQGLRAGQVSLPGGTGAGSAGVGSPGASAGGAATSGPNTGQFDATALLQMLMSNPQIQQALRSASVFGEDAERVIELFVPTEGAPTTVALPLSAVVSTVAELASRSALELEAALPSNDMEYLAGEGVEAQTGLVLHYFRMAGEAERFSDFAGDESEIWANEAGFY